MDRVRPDYSARLSTNQGEFLVDPTYDFIRVFKWLGHAVINIVTEDGMNKMHVDEATARQVHERVGIPLVELDWITESEYQKYLDIKADLVDDSWLE